MAHTLVRVGRVDPHDEAEFAEVAEELRALLHICADHLTNENELVHAALEARRPGSSAHIVNRQAGPAENRPSWTPPAGYPWSSEQGRTPRDGARDGRPTRRRAQGTLVLEAGATPRGPLTAADSQSLGSARSAVPGQTHLICSRVLSMQPPSA